MVSPGVVARGQRDPLLDGNSLRCRAVRDGDIDGPILQIVNTISRIGANPCDPEGLGTVDDAIFDECVGKSCDVTSAWYSPTPLGTLVWKATEYY